MSAYRVLHVIDHLGGGGAQELLRQLVKFRNRSIFDCEVACLHGHGVYFEALEELGIRTSSLSPSKFVPLHFLRFVWMLVTRRYDVLHFHLAAANLFFKPIARFLGKRVLFSHEHSNDPGRRENPRWARLDAFAHRYSTHVVAVCSPIASYLIEHESVAPENVSVIVGGVDLDVFGSRTDRAAARESLGLPQDGLIVAGVGRLAKEKNFVRFIEVAARVLRSEEVTFLIAGDGKRGGLLARTVRDRGLSREIRFLGFVRDMPALYAAVDLLLSTSNFEGTPMTITEAMASGVGIVAPRIDGIAEVLRHQENALLYPPADEEGAADAVIRMLRDTPLRERLLHSAREEAREKYAAPAAVKEVEDLYLKYLC